MGILERIKDIEHELSKTQKNKATTTHIGLLKSQLARLRTELMMPAPGSGKIRSSTIDVDYRQGNMLQSKRSLYSITSREFSK
jgi:uncharacterized protein